MEKVTLKNAKRMPFLATMYHDVSCRKAKSCTCKIEFITGPRGKRISQKTPMSFQIDALSSAEVPFAALHLPQVKQAIKSGWLKRVEVEPVAPAPSMAGIFSQPVED